MIKLLLGTILFEHIVEKLAFLKNYLTSPMIIKKFFENFVFGNVCQTKIANLIRRCAVVFNIPEFS